MESEGHHEGSKERPYNPCCAAALVRPHCRPLLGLRATQKDLLFVFASSMSSLIFPNLSQYSRFMAVNMGKKKYKILLQILFRPVIFILTTAL